MKRRDFLCQCGSAASLALMPPSLTAGPAQTLSHTEIPASPIGFGTGSLHHLPKDEAVSLLYRFLDAGANLFDTSPAYGGTETETLLGSILPQSAVLVSKTLSRTREGALTDLHDSLRRLHRDIMDVWLIHDLRTQDEWSACNAPGGILKAAMEAKQAGKIRAFGFSIHRHPLLAVQAIQSESVDIVMLPITPSRFWPEREMAVLVKELQKRQIGTFGFKCPEPTIPVTIPSHCALLGHQTINKWLNNQAGTTRV